MPFKKLRQNSFLFGRKKQNKVGDTPVKDLIQFSDDEEDLMQFDNENVPSSSGDHVGITRQPQHRPIIRSRKDKRKAPPPPTLMQKNEEEEDTYIPFTNTVANLKRELGGRVSPPPPPPSQPRKPLNPRGNEDPIYERIWETPEEYYTRRAREKIAAIEKVNCRRHRRCQSSSSSSSSSSSDDANVNKHMPMKSKNPFINWQGY